MEKKSSGLATTALVLGILSIPLVMLPIVPIGAFVTGIVAYNNLDESKIDNYWMARVGMILSFIPFGIYGLAFYIAAYRAYNAY